LTDAVETDLGELRKAYRNALAELTSPAPAAAEILDEIIAHPRFPGVSDPPVLGFLETLLRITQPQRVLELGTYIGLSAVFLGSVLRGNRRPGHLWTVDPDPTAQELARGWVGRAELTETVSFVEGHSTAPEVDHELRGIGPFDLVYLDSSHTYEGTLKELDLVFESPWLRADGLLVLHDASNFASRWDPTAQGGVRRALDVWLSHQADEYHASIFEPPFWPALPGLGLISRRRLSLAQAPSLAKGEDD
jgi:predicted O-methyltransferase YrrM